MKIRTNLSPKELQLISKGLTKAADQFSQEIILENKAEQDLETVLDKNFSLMLDNLHKEIYTLFSKDKS